MTSPLAPLRTVTLAAAMLAGLVGLANAQGSPPPSGGPPQDVTQPAPTGAPPQSAAPVDLPVLYITSVEVIRSALDPKLDIIRVRGITGSDGWNLPQLVPLFEGKAADNILDMQFIARVPSSSEPATGFVPISAIFPLEPGHPFTGVRVRGADNVVLVKQMPGYTEVKIGIEDCSKCVGKQFAPKGQAAAGTPGVVREEDMPRNFRVIPPNKGVAGVTHNMNRLNIVLGEDNKTIVQAFWE